MDKLYRISLKGTSFWHHDKVHGNYNFMEFSPNEVDAFNHIYFSKSANDVYTEKYTMTRFTPKSSSANNRVYPFSVYGINLESAVEVDAEEAIRAYKIIHDRALSKEYGELIRNVLIDSYLCERAVKIKKEREQKEKEAKSLLKRKKRY